MPTFKDEEILDMDRYKTWLSYVKEAELKPLKKPVAQHKLNFIRVYQANGIIPERPDWTKKRTIVGIQIRLNL